MNNFKLALFSLFGFRQAKIAFFMPTNNLDYYNRTFLGAAHDPIEELNAIYRGLHEEFKHVHEVDYFMSRKARKAKSDLLFFLNDQDIKAGMIVNVVMNNAAFLTAYWTGSILLPVVLGKKPNTFTPLLRAPDWQRYFASYSDSNGFDEAVEEFKEKFADRSKCSTCPAKDICANNGPCK